MLKELNKLLRGKNVPFWVICNVLNVCIPELATCFEFFSSPSYFVKCEAIHNQICYTVKDNLRITDHNVFDLWYVRKVHQDSNMVV